MTHHAVALTAPPTYDEAQRLADGLIDARLAACVQVTQSITSVYRWRDAVYHETEWQVWIKTAEDKLDALAEWLPEHHSGDVPELIYLPRYGRVGPLPGLHYRRDPRPMNLESGPETSA